MNQVFKVNNNNTLMNQPQDWNKQLEAVGRNQDKAAFVALFEHFSPLLKSFLLQSGGLHQENTEELVQETMIKVWQKAANYSAKQGAASTWIYTIARNTRIDSIRKQVRQNPATLNAEDVYGDNEGADPHAGLVQIRNKRDISEQLHGLPKEQVDVITMMYFKGKSTQQVADALDLPLGTVKSRIRLALAKMKLRLPENREPENRELGE
jgi:RNA polymerase sigma factor (sigma-70 family)